MILLNPGFCFPTKSRTANLFINDSAWKLITIKKGRHPEWETAFLFKITGVYFFVPWYSRPFLSCDSQPQMSVA